MASDARSCVCTRTPKGGLRRYRGEKLPYKTSLSSFFWRESLPLRSLLCIDAKLAGVGTRRGFCGAAITGGCKIESRWIRRRGRGRKRESLGGKKARDHRPRFPVPRDGTVFHGSWEEWLGDLPGCGRMRGEPYCMMLELRP